MEPPKPVPSVFDRSRAPLSPESLSSMAPAKIYKEAATNKGEASITSITFDDSGATCITGGEDDFFTHWDVTTGKRSKYFASQKYGLDQVTATHVPGQILHASTKLNHDIRLHSAKSNAYETYFKAHTQKVISIAMHPLQTVFLSGSEDQTVMMWDTRAAEAKGALKNLQGPALTAWECTGSVFAVALPAENAVCLYAASTFDRRPFIWTTLDDPALDFISTPRRTPLITSVSFSNNGSYILIGTSGDVHYILEAINLKIVARLEGHKGLERDSKTGEKGLAPRKGNSGQEVKWTPDSCFVMSGSYDGQIMIWDIRVPKGYHSDYLVPPEPEFDLVSGRKVPAITLRPMKVLNEAKLGGMSRVLMFSPKYNMFVSGGNGVVMWLPAKTKDRDEDDNDEAGEDMDLE